ncbi:MAG: Ribosomal small subunit methyltransferase [Candidatus Kaiserbacteria bacterium]|nr:Ribosomal small subunit methyltransferase [Candidatus Kaiserbacteria bacterium]
MKGARLGQHFLIHSWAARTLAHAVEPLEGEVIVEVGPGKGVLTRELLTLGPVIAIEKDEALVTLLNETFAAEISSGKLTIVSDDIRNVTPASLGISRYIVAANIPYYITGEIIRQFLTAKDKPRAMALLIQKEVAQRITGVKESILSLSVKAFGVPKIIAKVSKTHFSPPPSVDSAILAITDISGTFFDTITEEQFFTVVRAGFASKRKFVANNLAVVFEKEKVIAAMSECGIPEKARAEDIKIGEWKLLTEKLY